MRQRPAIVPKMSPPPLNTLLHARIRRWVLSAFPRDASGLRIDYDAPHGDPGLFGPDSVTWPVHACFPGMLAGGLQALMLQTLHPRALAGVWDHSNFRADLVGRLRRTTAFVGGTTYAPTAAAQALIERVRHIHDGVSGQTADGQAYDANDPALLTWVHVTEARGFLHGYQRFSGRRLGADDVDRYYDEVRRIAEALGARKVPDSAAAIAAYLRQVQPQLRYDARSREVLRILAGIRLPVPLPGLSRNLFLHAGASLLPDWAATMQGRNRWQRRIDRAAAGTLAVMAPWFEQALRDGVASRSCRRVGRDPSILRPRT